MAWLGFNLPREYDPMRIAPSLPGSDYFEPTAGLGAYVFAGVNGRAVARNLFLDGNSFQSSRKVDKMKPGGQCRAGRVSDVQLHPARLHPRHPLAEIQDLARRQSVWGGGPDNPI